MGAKNTNIYSYGVVHKLRLCITPFSIPPPMLHLVTIWEHPSCYICKLTMKLFIVRMLA